MAAHSRMSSGRSIWNILCAPSRASRSGPPRRFFVSAGLRNEDVERAIFKIALFDLLAHAPVMIVVIDRLRTILADAPVKIILDLQTDSRLSVLCCSKASSAWSISLASRIGEVACSATIRSNGPDVPSTWFSACSHAASEEARSPEISSGRRTPTAPAASAAARMASLSEETATTSTPLAAAACSTVQAISGLPQRSIRFLCGIPLEPPRAAITASVRFRLPSLISVPRDVRTRSRILRPCSCGPARSRE